MSTAPGRARVTFDPVPAEFIYTTYKLSRHYPPDRTVLEDISLSFYPGAKIGVIGANGAGKSSLLRIMAGLDDGFNGEARLTPGFSVGYLSQEPQLDAAKSVKENVLDGVREVHGLIEQYNAVMAKWSEPDADYEAGGRRAGGAGGQDQRHRRVGHRAQRRDRDGRAALSARRRRRDHALRRREAPRRAVPAAAPAPRPAAARRADQPPRRRVGRVARALPQGIPGTVVAVTHDRYFLDNVAQWILELDRGRGIPFAGNYSSWLEQKLERMGARAEAGRRAAAHARARTRMGAHGRQGPPGEGQGPTDRLREAPRGGDRREGPSARAGDRHPAGSAAGRVGHRRQRPAQGLRRPAADRGPDVLTAAVGHRRHHRPERRGQDDALPHDRGPGGARRRARSRSATRCS